MVLRDVRGALTRWPELAVTAHGRIWVDVPLGARRHRVRVTGADEWLRVEGRIVSMTEVEVAPRVADLALRLLRANSAAELVSLARDDDELVARCDVPPEADADELVDAIYRVARVADRWELLWTGADEG
jgi:hypothetical protein